MLDKLIYYDIVLKQYNLFVAPFISLGWLLVLGLQFIVDMLENLLNTVYSLIDFTQYQPVQDFINTFQPVLYLGFAASLIFLGYILIFSHGEKPKVLQNILLAIIVLTALPTFMVNMNNITLAGIDMVRGNTNISSSIISESIVDLKYVDQKGFDSYTVEQNALKGTYPTNGFVEDNLNNVKYINPIELITSTEYKQMNNPDLFSKYIDIDDAGNMVVEDIEKNKFFGIDITPWRYRYSVDFLTIFISLASIGTAIFFTAFKVGRLIYELAIHQFLAVIFSVTDLSSGQRTKQILKSILSIYVVIFLTTVMLQFFLLGQSFIVAKVPNPLIKSILLLIFAFATIDGPNIVERILGIDVGLQSGFKTVATMYAGAKIGGAAVKGAFNMGKNITSKIHDYAQNKGSSKASPLNQQSSPNNNANPSPWNSGSTPLNNNQNSDNKNGENPKGENKKSPMGKHNSPNDSQQDIQKNDGETTTNSSPLNNTFTDPTNSDTPNGDSPLGNSYQDSTLSDTPNGDSPLGNNYQDPTINDNSTNKSPLSKNHQRNHKDGNNIERKTSLGNHTNNNALSNKTPKNIEQPLHSSRRSNKTQLNDTKNFTSSNSDPTIPMRSKKKNNLKGDLK